MSRISESKPAQATSATSPERTPLPLRKRLLFAVIMLVAFLLVTEVAGRVVSWVAYGFNPYYLCYGFYSATSDGSGDDGHKFRFPHGGGHGYSKFPANTTIKNGVPEPCHINNRGLRGPDFDTKKAPGTFRVVCMGASSTFGFTDRDEGTYPRLLQKLFDEDGLSPKVEVINAGIPAMRSRNIVAMYENEIVDYDPDLVTYYEGYNDAHDVAEENTLQTVTRWLDEHSAAYAGIRKGVNKVFGPVFSAWWELPHVTREKAEFQARFHADDVSANLGRLIEMAQGRGTDVLLMKQPITMWYEKLSRSLVTEGSPRPTYEQQYREVEEKLRTTGKLQGWEVVIYVHHAILDRIPALATRYGLDVVDNIPTVDEKPERLATYVHLTEEANARLAEKIHKAIRDAQARKQAAGFVHGGATQR